MADQRPSVSEQSAAPQDDVLATLKEWRERGARAVDPVQFDFLEALARRTATCEGAARRLLDDKVEKALSRYRQACEQAGCRLDEDRKEAPSQSTRGAKPVPATAGALAQMLAQLEGSRQGDTTVAPHAARATASGVASATPKVGQKEQAAPTVPAQRIGEAQEALAYFRRTWTRLDARRRLAQSRANLPVNAGPLNSQQLVHRALTLMQGAAPGYLHQLMAYVDALSALEPFQPAAMAAAAAAPTEPARGESRAGGAAKKAGRTKRG